MYFVKGIRPELAIDSTTPNEKFYELYQRLCLAQWPEKTVTASSITATLDSDEMTQLNFRAYLGNNS